MWKPSILESEAMIYEDMPFHELCSNYHAYYVQHVKNFELMATIAENIHKKYGIEGILTEGITTSLLGNLILNIKLHPTYKIEFGDPEYSVQEKIAYAEDYLCQFTIVIQGEADAPECVLGLKVISKYGIMMTEIPKFDVDKWDKQKIPAWYVDGVKEFLS